MNVEAGEIRALLGENGAGKSTLGKIVAGVYAPDPGAVPLDGAELGDIDEKAAGELGIGIVHQEGSLVAAAARWRRTSSPAGSRRGWLGQVDGREMRDGPRRCSPQLGVDDRPGAARSRALSPAQAQIVEIAKALSHDLRAPDPRRADRRADPDRDGAAVRHRPPAAARPASSIIYVSHRLAEIFALCRPRHRAQGRPARRHAGRRRDRHRRADPADGRPRRASRARRPAGAALGDGACSRPKSSRAAARARRLDRGARRRDRLPRGSGRLGAQETLRGDLRCARRDGGRDPGGRPAVRLRGPVGRHGGRHRHGAGGPQGGGPLPRPWTSSRNIAVDRARQGLVRRHLLGGARPRRWPSASSSELRIATPSACARRSAIFRGGNQQKVLLAKWLAMEPRAADRRRADARRRRRRARRDLPPAARARRPGRGACSSSRPTCPRCWRCRPHRGHGRGPHRRRDSPATAPPRSRCFALRPSTPLACGRPRTQVSGARGHGMDGTLDRDLTDVDRGRGEGLVMRTVRRLANSRELTLFVLVVVLAVGMSVVYPNNFPTAAEHARRAAEPGAGRHPGLRHDAPDEVRGRRPDGRRPADGRLVQLQQVLAAGRPALGGPGRELRDPAHAVGRRADPPRRHDEPPPDRRAAGRAGSRLVRRSASRSAS